MSAPAPSPATMTASTSTRRRSAPTPSIGSNSALVAPVTIGDGAIVGAGSVITQRRLRRCAGARPRPPDREARLCRQVPGVQGRARQGHGRPPRRQGLPRHHHPPRRHGAADRSGDGAHRPREASAAIHADAGCAGGHAHFERHNREVAQASTHGQGCAPRRSRGNPPRARSRHPRRVGARAR